jgi:hypothetical protein
LTGPELKHGYADVTGYVTAHGAAAAFLSFFSRISEEFHVF